METDWVGVVAICFTIVGAAFVADRRLTKVESTIDNMRELMAIGIAGLKADHAKLEAEKAILESKVGRQGESIARMETQLGALGSCAANNDRDAGRTPRGNGGR